MVIQISNRRTASLPLQVYQLELTLKKVLLKSLVQASSSLWWVGEDLPSLLNFTESRKKKEEGEEEEIVRQWASPLRLEARVLVSLASSLLVPLSVALETMKRSAQNPQLPLPRP